MAARRAEAVAANYRVRLRAVRAETMRRLAAAYAKTMREDEIKASYAEFVPLGARHITAGQGAAQTLTRAYLRGVGGADPLPVPNLAGTSKAGHFGPVPEGSNDNPTGTITEALGGLSLFILSAIGKGASATEAINVTGAYFVDRVADNELTRVVDAEIDGQKARATGWVGIIGAPSDACAGNAGFHTFDEEIYRHPGCVIGSTVVDVLPQTFMPASPSSADSRGAIHVAMRRWYSGEVITIRTATGNLLTVTPNHPILTDRGWVPAGLLNEGDHVVRSLWEQRPLGGISPDEYDVPARIEDVFGARSVAGLLSVPTSTEDFHGDGLDGQVSVVAPYRLLRRRAEAAINEPTLEDALRLGTVRLAGFDGEGDLVPLGIGMDSTAGGLMRGGGERGSLVGRQLEHAEDRGRAPSTDRDGSVDEDAADRRSLVAVLPRDRQLGEARNVVLDDRQGDLGGHVDEVIRFDPAGSYVTAEGRALYAKRGADLLERLSGLVTLDRIVDQRRSEWSDHVYNLTTREGWYNANGLIIANCNCEREIQYAYDTGNVALGQDLNRAVGVARGGSAESGGAVR